MSKLRSIFCAALVPLLTACVLAAPPELEGLVQVTEKFAGAAELAPPGQRQCRLTMNDESEQSAAIRQDLSELSDAISTNVGNLELVTVRSTPNGRTLAATKSNYVSDPVEPLGVWIWPDWRNAANVIHVPNFSQIKVLSNFHFYLTHDPRKHGGERTTCVIDWRNPQHLFEFKRFKRHLLRIADNGRWACPTSAGALVVGWLDANDPGWAEHTFAIPLTTEPRALMFTGNGSQLIVETTDGENVLHSFVVTDNAAIPTDTELGYMYSDTLPLADDAFVAVVPPVPGGVNKMVTVGANAAMTISTLEWDADGDENPRGASPSGKYIVTQSRAWPPGTIQTRMRKSPKAGANDPMPSMPQTHSEIGGGEMWLSWDAP